jgi:hypothetical protein
VFIFQYFSLGFHQGSFDFNNEDAIISASNAFYKSNIPVDALWLVNSDIFYEKRYAD